MHRSIVGAFACGAIDSPWDRGADRLGDWGNAVSDGVPDVGDTFEAAGDLAGDVSDSIF